MVSIENANYSPDLLWDYLSLNFENQIINSPDGQSWLIARDCLSRLEATQHSSLEIRQRRLARFKFLEIVFY